MNLNDFPTPKEAFVITHVLVVADQDRSREFHRSLLGRSPYGHLIEDGQVTGLIARSDGGRSRITPIECRIVRRAEAALRDSE